MSNKIGRMSKDKKQKAPVPRLRFPEFRDASAWKEKQLKHLFDERTEKGGEELPLLSLTDVEGLIRQEHSGRKDNSNADKSRYARVYPGDIAYNTMRMWEGRSARACEGGLVSPAYTVCTPKGDADSKFFAFYFKTAQAIEQFRRYSQGLVKDTLSLKFERFSKIRLATPSLPEQQRIANCLGSLDDLVAAEGRKLAALRDCKQGLMQQLFPRNDESQPGLRFPEFRDAGDWEVKKAGDLFGQRKKKGEPGLPIYSVTINDGMVLRANFDRNFYDIKDPAGNKKAYKNDIVYNMMRMWQGACGVAPEDCMVSPAYVALKPKAGTCPAFFVFLFKRPDTLHRLTAHSRGLTLDRLRLYFEDFASIHLLVPTEAEQRRIADCLSTLDTFIAAQVSKLDALRTHKRGLMQQLFPSPEDAEA